MLFHTACPFTARALCHCPHGPGGAAAPPLLDITGTVVSSQLYATRARQLAAAWANPDSLWSDGNGVDVLFPMPPPLPSGVSASAELLAAVRAAKRKLVAAFEELRAAKAAEEEPSTAEADATTLPPVEPLPVTAATPACEGAATGTDLPPTALRLVAAAEIGQGLDTARVSIFCQLPGPPETEGPVPLSHLSLVDPSRPPLAWHPGRVVRCFGSGSTRLKLDDLGMVILTSAELRVMASSGHVALMRLPKPKTPRMRKVQSMTGEMGDGDAAAVREGAT